MRGIGNDWRAKITQAILKCDTVLAFFSEHSLRKDSVCLNELAIAVGHLSRMIGRVTAVDRNKEYLNRPEHDDSVQYICGYLDCESLPEEVNDIDAIVFSYLYM